MKRISFALILSITISCNNANEKNNDRDSVESEPIFETAEFLNSNSARAVVEAVTANENFNQGNLASAEEWSESTAIETPFRVSKKFLKDYSSVLVFSPDSSKILDYGSYNDVVTQNDKGQTTLEGGDPDTEVAVIDLNTNKRKRLFFSGPSGSIEAGAWLNDSTVMFSGYFDEHNGKTDTLFWIVNIKSMLFQKFGYKKQ
jgi:hypothetical protein